MTGHTLTLSSAGFPWPQPRRRGLPRVQVSVLQTLRGRQAGGQLAGGGSCVCTRQGAATRGCCVFAFHPSSRAQLQQAVFLGGCLTHFASEKVKLKT